MNHSNLEKINLLSEICLKLNSFNIKYTIGGSSLLYYLGLWDKINDFDICVFEDEKSFLEKYEKIFSNKIIKEENLNPIFTSDYIYNCNYNNQVIDWIGNFKINNSFGKTFEMKYRVFKTERNIAWGHPEDWKKAYKLMERNEKSALLEHFLTQMNYKKDNK